VTKTPDGDEAAGDELMLTGRGPRGGVNADSHRETV
jgi:hypothetical protein